MIQNPYARACRSLAGAWQAIVDPYENGYYDYRYQPHTNGYFANQKPASKSELVEYDFDRSGSLLVPGDWNSQRRELFLYEGTVWYKTDFALSARGDRRYFLYFGAANYEAKVYLNGELVGAHEGGFTPFNVEVSGRVRAQNFLVVKVDNRRRREGVPTLNTDWWNYGGLTREVLLLEVPRTFVRDYAFELEPRAPSALELAVELDGDEPEREVTLGIPELGISLRARAGADGVARFTAQAAPRLWSPEAPQLYTVEIATADESVRDRVGFRTLERRGQELLLNGEPIFLRGISIHEQAPLREGRAVGDADARALLAWARELGANFVRLAHYPHAEHMVRAADELGFLVWAEIPVYWTIDWENAGTLANAKNQLREMIVRDKNRACVAIWSVGNETPRSEARLAFMSELVRTVRSLDDSRWVSAALEKRELRAGQQLIDDPLGELLDVLGLNEYVGWYDGLPEKARSVSFQTPFDKPLVISEFGADALAGFHADALTRFSEEYQADVYEKQIEMFERIAFLRGISPWILADFRSPRRPLPGIQDFWNRKGLISNHGQKKRAFYVLRDHYRALAARRRAFER